MRECVKLVGKSLFLYPHLTATAIFASEIVWIILKKKQNFKVDTTDRVGNKITSYNNTS